MLIAKDICTSMKALCFCGPSWVKRRVERDFAITHWNLGPYQEYRCTACGNQALLHPELKVLMVAVWNRPVYDHKEQVKRYAEHCR